MTSLEMTLTCSAHSWWPVGVTFMALNISYSYFHSYTGAHQRYSLLKGKDQAFVFLAAVDQAFG